MSRKPITEKENIRRCGECAHFKINSNASPNIRFGRCKCSKRAARPYDTVVPRCLAVDCPQFALAAVSNWTPRNIDPTKLDF